MHSGSSMLIWGFPNLVLHNLWLLRKKKKKQHKTFYSEHISLKIKIYNSLFLFKLTVSLHLSAWNLVLVSTVFS